MARLPYVDPASAPVHVADALERLPHLNIFRLVAHAETSFRPFLELGRTILVEQRLSAAVRELAILRVARLSRAEYEWVQHVPIALACGATQEQVDAIDRGEVEADCFDESTRIALRFATEVIEDVRPSDATFAATAERFSPREIVELTLAVGYYMAIARVMEVGDIDLDEPLGAQVIEGAMDATNRRPSP